MFGISTMELVLLGVLGCSGIQKIVAPKDVQELWPRIPTWSWPICGAVEALGPVLFALTPYKRLGFFLSYGYMGGVLSCICIIQNHDGHTIISGKSPLGKMGFMPLLFATLTTYAITTLDDDITTTSSMFKPIVYGLLGSAYAIICANYEGKEKKK